MRPRLLLPLLVLLIPASLHAQQPVPRLEVGGELSRWRLDAGTASSDGTRRTSGTVRLGLVMPTRAPMLLQLGATYAPESDRSPGLLHLEAEAAPRLLRTGVSGSNVFVSFGAGALRFEADRQQAVIAACRLDPRCMYEANAYRSGWRASLNAGVGADVAAGDAVMLRPTAQVMRLLGDGAAGPSGEHTFLRFGVGLYWRP